MLFTDNVFTLHYCWEITKSSSVLSRVSLWNKHAESDIVYSGRLSIEMLVFCLIGCSYLQTFHHLISLSLYNHNYTGPPGDKWQNFVSEPIFIFFTVKFKKDLRRKLELQLPHPLKSVATLPCEMQVVNYAALQHS